MNKDKVIKKKSLQGEWRCQSILSRTLLAPLAMEASIHALKGCMKNLLNQLKEKLYIGQNFKINGMMDWVSVHAPQDLIDVLKAVRQKPGIL